MIRILALSFILLTSLILTQNSWPSLLSRQGQIDPNNIAEEYSNETIAFFNNKPIAVPNNIPSQVLGEVETNSDDKYIEVDLTNQRLYAFENDEKVYEFIISSGSWDRTPTGTFTIWTKIKSQKMSGGSKELGTYYYLPNVPYILFFYNDQVPKKLGYSLHGTYWHNNFGVPMSHGCINMVTNEVAQIFNWAEVGTKIIIHGKYQTILPQASVNTNTSNQLL